MPHRLQKKLEQVDPSAGYKSPPRYQWEFHADAKPVVKKSSHPHPLKSCAVPQSPKKSNVQRPKPHRLDTIEEELSRSFQARQSSVSSEYTEGASSVSSVWSDQSTPASSARTSPNHSRSRSASKSSNNITAWWARSPKIGSGKNSSSSSRRGSLDSGKDALAASAPRMEQLQQLENKLIQRVRFYVPISPKQNYLPKTPHPGRGTAKALSTAAAHLPQDDSEFEPPLYSLADSSSAGSWTSSSAYHADYPDQALPPRHHIIAPKSAPIISTRPVSPIEINNPAVPSSPLVSPCSSFHGGNTTSASNYSPVSPVAVKNHAPPQPRHRRPSIEPGTPTNYPRTSLDSSSTKRQGSVGMDSPAFNLPSPVSSTASNPKSPVSPRTAQQLQQEREWIWRLKETNVAEKAKVQKAKAIDVSAAQRHGRKKSVGLGILVQKPRRDGNGEEFRMFPSPSPATGSGSRGQSVGSPMWEAVARRVGEGDRPQVMAK
ncbi:MAG: hypothetical protein Q9227_003727 [Pyrenula ochraceoflavens]